jgi:uncharacterized coiled-coil protein SlyX
MTTHIQGIPPIPPEEMTATVRLLLAFIAQQQQTIEQLQQQVQRQQIEIEALKDEVARLQRRPAKPKIRPSTLPKDDTKADDDDDNDSAGQGGGSDRSQKANTARKRKKKLTIHETKIIKPDALPAGSRLLGYADFTVQDLLVQPHNTRYRLARYRTPDGDALIGKLPKDVQQGGHFGTLLKGFILYRYYHQRVTQPLILQQLTEWGVAISSGQISRILTEEKADFHAEKDALLRAGINSSRYIQVDDTGSRHDGKNGYCTHIGNQDFAWFASTGSKSRINFLQLLRATSVDYTINAAALDYMRAEGLSKTALARIAQSPHSVFADEQAWTDHLPRLGIRTQRHVRIATEGALLGTLIDQGFPPDLVILSDDAGQFNVLLHALCWVHANRVFQRILPLNDRHAKEIAWVHTQIWEIYADLKQYKRQQTAELKTAIKAHFDELCSTKTSFATLNQALKRLSRNKDELLLALKRPDIPLHNNLSEGDIREYVIKRKISGSTRSENGRRCRDTFASLKKTCKKHAISFWEFVIDRLRPHRLIPYLPDLLAGKASLLEAS